MCGLMRLEGHIMGCVQLVGQECLDPCADMYLCDHLNVGHLRMGA